MLIIEYARFSMFNSGLVYSNKSDYYNKTGWFKPYSPLKSKVWFKPTAICFRQIKATGRSRILAELKNVKKSFDR
jgi:hypothetical protein